jgi:hypothetical protein
MIDPSLDLKKSRICKETLSRLEVQFTPWRGFGAQCCQKNLPIVHTIVAKTGAAVNLSRQNRTPARPVFYRSFPA